MVRCGGTNRLRAKDKKKKVLVYFHPSGVKEQIDRARMDAGDGLLWADEIREKRRIQMAEKRAAIKAKRRVSDKPRPTKLANAELAASKVLSKWLQQKEAAEAGERYESPEVNLEESETEGPVSNPGSPTFCDDVDEKAKSEESSRAVSPSTDEEERPEGSGNILLNNAGTEGIHQLVGNWKMKFTPDIKRAGLSRRRLAGTALGAIANSCFQQPKP
ncbi:hypothetical protein C8F04DRAFT_1191737 [Mycena alexandri]|uniref:Uncharacterized protein n=1 Tax=Mycena alexandri TaxID=1745969 RepID=A0AAD6SCW8_9AGAR|nr:hypothetical protein C8F04DRAFT_1191737 [Mycena alexandri]